MVVIAATTTLAADDYAAPIVADDAVAIAAAVAAAAVVVDAAPNTNDSSLTRAFPSQAPCAFAREVCGSPMNLAIAPRVPPHLLRIINSCRSSFLELRSFSNG